MEAFNVVRFRVKPGQEQAFVDAHRRMNPDFMGLKQAVLIKTGERSYCFVGQWDAMASIVAARPGMVGLLDSFRGMLEDLGGSLGATDPVSGEVAVRMK